VKAAIITAIYITAALNLYAGTKKLNPELVEIRQAWSNLKSTVKTGKPRSQQDKDFVKKVQQLKSDLKEYTLTHSGEDLDYWYWGVPFKHFYCLLINVYAFTYEQSEALTKEALDILHHTDAEKPETAERVALGILDRHMWRWAKADPLKSGKLLDSEYEYVKAMDKKQVYHYWNYFMPMVEQYLLKCSQKLPKEEQAEFFKARLASLKRLLLSEYIKSDVRFKVLRVWIVYQNAFGQWEEAVSVLNEVWNESGEAITDPDYFFCWMWIALHWEGDWNKASAILRHVTELASEGKIKWRLGDYEELTRAYYDRIQFPCYELKRQISMIEKRRRE